PVWVLNFSMSGSCLLELGEVGRAGQMTEDPGRDRDVGRHEVRTTALALASLEVAVGRRRAELPRRQLVGVHAEAHRAAGTAPLRTGVLEDDVEALLLGLQAYADRAGHDQDAGVVGDLVTLDERGRDAQVLDASVGARADEHRV